MEYRSVLGRFSLGGISCSNFGVVSFSLMIFDDVELGWRVCLELRIRLMLLLVAALCWCCVGRCVLIDE